MDKKSLIYDFIKNHSTAVISTVSPLTLPESSVVGFYIKDDFEIHIATYAHSRKFQNIKRNPAVALVFGPMAGKTVQLEGQAEQVTDAEKIKEIEWTDMAKMPTVANYIKPEEVVFLKISPKWLKYSDFSASPWEIEELRFE